VTLRRDDDGNWQFRHGDGDWRTLVNPDGPATERQLRKLARLGLLAAPTKLEAARAIDEALDRKAATC
jgi:hypothetical protein